MISVSSKIHQYPKPREIQAIQRRALEEEVIVCISPSETSDLIQAQ
nr:MAG TPA: hypothetical protein [Caudoviricetes sp.]